METFGDWVGLVGGIAGILILLTGAFVFVKGSYSKARIESLREANEDLRSRVDDLEDELGRASAKEEALEVKVESLVSENKLLADMITQRANVEAIADMLDHHHSEAMKAWSDIAGLLKERGE